MRFGLETMDSGSESDTDLSDEYSTSDSSYELVRYPSSNVTELDNSKVNDIFNEVVSSKEMEDTLNEVKFEDIFDLYPFDSDIVTNIKFPKNFIKSKRDRVYLFRVGWKEIEERLFSTKIKNDFVILKGKKIPKLENIAYELCYCSGGNQIVGKSCQFKFRSLTDNELMECNTEKDDDSVLIIRSRFSVLMDKFANCLKHTVTSSVIESVESVIKNDVQATKPDLLNGTTFFAQKSDIDVENDSEKVADPTQISHDLSWPLPIKKRAILDSLTNFSVDENGKKSEERFGSDFNELKGAESQEALNGSLCNDNDTIDTSSLSELERLPSVESDFCLPEYDFHFQKFPQTYAGLNNYEQQLLGNYGPPRWTREYKFEQQWKPGMEYVVKFDSLKPITKLILDVEGEDFSANIDVYESDSEGKPTTIEKSDNLIFKFKATKSHLKIFLNDKLTTSIPHDLNFQSITKFKLSTDAEILDMIYRNVSKCPHCDKFETRLYLCAKEYAKQQIKLKGVQKMLS